MGPYILLFKTKGVYFIDPQKRFWKAAWSSPSPSLGISFSSDHFIFFSHFWHMSSSPSDSVKYYLLYKYSVFLASLGQQFSAWSCPPSTQPTLCHPQQPDMADPAPFPYLFISAPCIFILHLLPQTHSVHLLQDPPTHSTKLQSSL